MMSSYRWWTVAFVIVIGMFALAVHSSRVVAQPAPANALPQWEYKALRVSGLAPDSDLNDVGAQGWELVAFARIPDSSFNHYVFKRPKRP